MEKIPTILMRDETDRRYVTNEVNPEAAWVFTTAKGLQITRKYDGTCVMFDGDAWYARRQVKKGKKAPENFTPVHFDEVTGHTMGWEPIEQSSFYGAFQEAAALDIASEVEQEPGTYELCGPKINGNPDGFSHHILISHRYAFDYNYGGGSLMKWDVDELNQFVLHLRNHGIEGIVAKHPDGRMAKLKGRDFR